MYVWNDFKEIWVVDFEFYGTNGNPPVPICYCAKEINSGQIIKRWIENDKSPLYSIKNDALFVAFFASAEIGCHISLQWQRPPNISDLYAEFRNITNGQYLQAGRGLLGACIYYNVKNGDASLKETMRDRILQGPPYSESDREKILDYCLKDVQLTSELFLKMKSRIDLQRSLLRGRYMWASAMMENFGVPIDVESLDILKSNWDNIKIKLIEKVDANYHVYEGTTFKLDKFSEFLSKNNIPWEFTPSGHPKTDDNFMKDQSKTFQILKPLQELRYTLGQLKLNDLQIGSDGRNRALLSPFGTITSRNTPSSSKFIFGNAVWLRNLIKPSVGNAISYVDYEQQEIGIAAALSGDENLITAYKSGDPYMNFAIQAGVVPANATKNTHPDIRERFKTCMLGINYGMHYTTFSKRTNIPLIKARELYKMHYIVFSKYWDWIHEFMDRGQLTGLVSTKFGWDLNTKCSKSGTLQNFPMQGNGADILRVAICLCLENNVRVIAPVHDAILIESTIDDIDRDVVKTSKLMSRAAECVVNFPLRVEAKTIKYPDHYSDRRGDVMWKSIWEVVDVERK